VSGRAVWRFSNKSTARVVLRVGTSGIDLELGGTQRISEFSTAGLGVSVGLGVCPWPPLCLTLPRPLATLICSQDRSPRHVGADFGANMLCN
jgi:hypothetical protein